MSLIKAADDARRLLRGFRAFEEVAAALEQAGVAEQRKAEAEKLLAELGPQIEAGKAHVDAAKKTAAETVAHAKAQAEQITGAASAKAMTQVADAQTAAANTELAAEEIKAKASALLAQAQAEVLGALAKREQLEEECEALEKRLAKAQAQIAKLLG